MTNYAMEDHVTLALGAQTGLPEPLGEHATSVELGGKIPD